MERERWSGNTNGGPTVRVKISDAGGQGLIQEIAFSVPTWLSKRDLRLNVGGQAGVKIIGPWSGHYDASGATMTVTSLGEALPYPLYRKEPG